MTFYSPSDLYLSLAFWEKMLALGQSRDCREKTNPLYRGKCCSSEFALMTE